ncbi:hypothetical protein TEA_000485 [Camellia sinensis var. sinensis]|uniref:Uncharacterized protein n=1 Tax=Camellia sinensis var. sinensis TaxID=542762 RepID=A0A4S4EYE4_CAMSN|nr:hypothetical protein TEA_000485 [Camellia sinensis var. sinensis]
METPAMYIPRGTCVARWPTNDGIAVASQASSANIKKKTEKHVDDGGGDIVEAVPNLKLLQHHHWEVLVSMTIQLHWSRLRHTIALKFRSSHLMARFEYFPPLQDSGDVNDSADAAKLIENMGLSKEVNGSSEYGGMDSGCRWSLEGRRLKFCSGMGVLQHVAGAYWARRLLATTSVSAGD